MKLSEQNATKIVTRISEIIGQHVNMMDEKGVILSSTNPKRIGTFHGGAAKLIKEKLDILIIEDDNQFEGARKGINLPLMLYGNVVGVIGVTGEHAEVVKYVQIVKNMT